MPRIVSAKLLYAPDATWSAEVLRLFTQAVIQGSFILAKAKNGPEIATECLGHLRRYLEMLFNQPKPKEEDHDPRRWICGSRPYCQSRDL